MKKLLKGGTVVSADSVKPLDIIIEKGKIVEVGENLPKTDDLTIVDVTDRLIFPGFIDAHTHFDLEVAGTVTADDFYSGSRSAIAGGTTTIIDFATQNSGESLAYAFEAWTKKSKGKTSCDYGFHIAISEWNDNVKAEIPTMIKKGITSFKVYMTYSNMLNDREIYEVISEVNKYGGIVGVHCENSGIIEALVKEKKAKGRLGVSSHPETRPKETEAEAISRLCRIAEVANAPVIVVHLSTKEGYNEIIRARGRGVKVFAETCPQYLLMDDSLYYKKGFLGGRYVCAPPLRKKTDNECLWKGILDGSIDTVSTDHCSFTLAQKEMGIDDFTKIPGGMPGVETRAYLIYTYGVREGRISLSDMARVLCEYPAKLYGIYPKKGIIAKGSDADIVVYNQNGGFKISKDNQFCNVDYAPFSGTNILGGIERVYLRGEDVFFKGEIKKECKGRFLKRIGFKL